MPIKLTKNTLIRVDTTDEYDRLIPALDSEGHRWNIGDSFTGHYYGRSSLSGIPVTSIYIYVYPKRPEECFWSEAERFDTIERNLYKDTPRITVDEYLRADNAVRPVEGLATIRGSFTWGEHDAS